MSGPLTHTRARDDSFPGCERRKVKRCQLVDGGAFLKLDCGHEQWLGGVTIETVICARRPCLEGPCYQFEKPMGIHC